MNVENTNAGLESQIFQWEVFITAELELAMYGHITLVVDVGDHKKGDKFSSAEINYFESELTLYRHEEKTGNLILEESYSLNLTIR